MQYVNWCALLLCCLSNILGMLLPRGHLPLLFSLPLDICMDAPSPPSSLYLRSHSYRVFLTIPFKIILLFPISSFFSVLLFCIAFIICHTIIVCLCMLFISFSPKLKCKVQEGWDFRLVYSVLYPPCLEWLTDSQVFLGQMNESPQKQYCQNGSKITVKAYLNDPYRYFFP